MRPSPRLPPLAGLLLLLAPAGAGAQAVARTPQVTATLLSYGSWIQPGSPLAVAVRLEVAAGWYVYWHQPGEAGLPTTVTWRLPRGFRAGGLRFPVPERYVVAGLTTHVHHDDLVLLDTMAAPRDVRGRQTVRATVRYGVCRDVCIPQTVELSLTLPVRDRPPDPDLATRTLFSDAREATPQPPPPGSRIAARRDGERLCLVVDRGTGAGDGAAPDSLLFFPGTPTPYAGAMMLARLRAGTPAVYRLPPASPPPSRLGGVIATDVRRGTIVDVPVERGSCDD